MNSSVNQFHNFHQLQFSKYQESLISLSTNTPETGKTVHSMSRPVNRYFKLEKLDFKSDINCQRYYQTPNADHSSNNFEQINLFRLSEYYLIILQLREDKSYSKLWKDNFFNYYCCDKYNTYPKSWEQCSTMNRSYIEG